jgi:5-methylcytosine-specific restriction endonuclease McrA
MKLPGMPATEQILKELRARYHNGEKHLHADHIIDVESRRDLRLDLDNMATRCNDCHRIKTTNSRKG